MADIDRVAQEIMRLGKIGRMMPPAWDGAKISHPVSTHEGIHLGRILPGRGLYLDCDLKYLGINKELPHVYQKTRVSKLFDVLKNEKHAILAAGLIGSAILFPRTLPANLMMAIQTYDGIINARGNGLGFDAVFTKATITTVANIWFSLLNVAGTPTSVSIANIPGGTVFDNTVNSSLIFGQVPAPTGGNKAYLQSFGYTSTVAANTILLIDLLVAAGNISDTLITTQTITSSALTRYTTGAGVMMIMEVTSASLGGTAANVTVTYTNSGGAGSRTTAALAMTTSAIQSRLQPGSTLPFMALQAGDFGVQSIQSLILSASMVGVGTLAIEQYYPLMFVPGVAVNSWSERDQAIQMTGLKELVQTSGNNVGHLGMFLFGAGAASGLITGMIRTCQG